MSKLEDFEESVKFVKSKIGDLKPEIGIVAGSGLKDLGKLIENPITIPYHDIPNFLESGAPGHGHELLIGKLSGCVVMIMTGRFHCYEGYEISKTTCGIRLMQLIGVKLLIATNAAGGINSNYRVGDIMVFEDHINLLGFGGNNPLVGKNDERLGCRFPSVTNIYDPKNTDLIFDICCDLKYDNLIHKGVYSCLCGPNFETRAECEMLRRVGVDAVGMSTVPEVLVAVHGGMKVIALSLITDESVLPGEIKEEPDEQKVIEVGIRSSKIMNEIMTKLVERIHNNDFTVRHNIKKIDNNNKSGNNNSNNYVIVGLVLFGVLAVLAKYLKF